MFVGVATTGKTTLPPCYNQYIPQMAAKIVWVQILCIVTYQKLKVCVGILQYSFPRCTCTVYSVHVFKCNQKNIFEMQIHVHILRCKNLRN